MNACRRLPCQVTLSLSSSSKPSSQFLAGIYRRQAPVNVPCWFVNSVVTARQPFSTSPRRRDDSTVEKLGDHEQEDRVRQHQVRRPWHREDADAPPVKEPDHPKSPLRKGKLLTTPTRLLKLILPLPVSVEKDTSNNSTKDYARAISSNEEIQPLALLVHPQQPLSYVERLIQAELPPVIEDGKEKIPNVYFRAEDTEGSSSEGTTQSELKHRQETNQPSASAAASGDQQTPDNVASFSGLGREGPKREHKEKNWVRWSSSTEMGDFIRDAARGREFAIEVEGYGIEMRVGVPSFNDRTYYMRMRLRKMTKQIEAMASLKHECDELAHRSAHRLAKGGFVLLSGWWGVVYYITFQTEYGWDLVEPVTYLAGLTTIMGGYLWFLYINRDLSYKAAMNITVSRRQNALYESRGFDIRKWEGLVEEANALRKEIKAVAVEYDVEWDETKILGDEVKDVLDKEKKGKKKAVGDDEDEEEGDDDKSTGKTENKKAEDKKGATEREKADE
ncbi:hypothetical protein GE09DRAFT_1069379 [Coniochaeta sp. 2T2.1]|nr:hypothetical protein GE09DRAFT_1069379 [Coniochaeta sp. 2T2.1]